MSSNEKNKPYGCNGRVLRVDLTSLSITEEILEPPIYRRYLGGGALSLYYLLKEMKSDTDPLGPENLLVFAASVLTGTPLMGLSRYTVAAKSPLTGGFGEAEAGGWWGPELKFAGYDAVVIKGRAEKPVYLWIKDAKAELRDASHLWGQFSRETQDMIREELGDNKVRVALIRSGLGAVMGSKNLKAIAVRGKNRMELYDEKSVMNISRGFIDSFKKDPGGLGELGTAGFVAAASAMGILPTRNFREGAFEYAEDISGELMHETMEVGRGTCYRCPVRCKRKVKVDDELYRVDPEYGGPEYETIGAFGSLCGVGNLKAVARANQLCQAYTLDTISTGASIAFAMECFENGIISQEDTGGLDLRFGNADAMLRMIEMIGKREAFGDILADGMKEAAEKIGNGSHKYAMHVKGQPLPLHEPRGKVGVSLAYAVSPTGADHMEALHDPLFENEEVMKFARPLGIIEPVPALELSSRKVRMFIYLQQLYNLFNSIGICNFTAHPWGPVSINGLVDYVNAVTGWETSLWELMKVGERHSCMARMFNIRGGMTSEEDNIPGRLFEPLIGGPHDGNKIDMADFKMALETYYQMMGWDEHGIPADGKLQELELEWIA
jgi:aldehyde:ferredoxin oxidoreductase